MDKIKVIVAGSRTCNNYKLVEAKLDKILVNYKPEDITIISGTASGADSLGEQYAHNHNCKLIKCPADWNKYGKSAGYRRNQYMASIADACVVFWDGSSKGSKHMIDIATDKKLPLRVVRTGGTEHANS